MTSRTFASWVEPVNAKQADKAAEIVELARSIPSAAWELPSPLEGWSYKDLIAHLASNDDMRYLLNCVIAKEHADPDRFAIAGAAELNAREIAERRDRTVGELIAEFEAQETDNQDLYSRLTEDDKDWTQDDIPWTLGLALTQAETGFHYRQHHEHLATALDA